MNRPLALPRPPAPPGGLRQPAAVILTGLAAGACALGAVTSSSPVARGVFTAAVVVPVVCVLAGDVRRLLLVVVVLDVPLAVDVNLDYRDDAAALGALGGLGISLTTAALAVLWILALAERRTEATGPAARAVIAPATAFVGAAALSAVVAADRELSAFEVTMLVQSLLLLAYVATRVRSAALVRLLVGAMLAGLTLEGVIAAAAYSGWVLDVAGVSARVDNDGFARVGGTVGGPNSAGAYFALLLLLALATMLAPAGRGLRALAAGGFVVGLFGLVVTFSRGGWIGFGAGLVVFCAIGWRRRWFSSRAPVIVAVTLAAVLLPLAGPVGDRLVQSDQGSAASRGPLAVTALRISRDHPVLGVGSNNYTVALPAYQTRDRATEWSYTVHDKYLLVLAETGIVGLAAFVWFLAATLRAGARGTRARDPVMAMISGGLTAGIVGQCVHMGVDTFRGRPATQGLFLVAGLVAALAAMAEHAARGDATR